MKNWVLLKGDLYGVTVVIHEEAPFSQVIDELSKKIMNNAHFFSSGLIRFQLGQRTLQRHEKKELLELFFHQGKVLLIEFLEERKAKVGQIFSENPPSQDINCRIIEGTLRSGQKVDFHGSLLVFGDVNPGAEIVSTGNIYVLGSLRGMAYAGSLGDEGAYVYASVFKPTQLRIAGYIARSPDQESKDNGPEIARIIKGTIIVEPFNY